MTTIELTPAPGTGRELLETLQSALAETKSLNTVEVHPSLQPPNSTGRYQFDLSPEVTKIVVSAVGGSGLAGLLTLLRGAFLSDRQFKTVCGTCGSPIEVSLARGTERQFDELVRKAIQIHSGCAPKVHEAEPPSQG
jgi:hypothetical protein